MLDALPFPLVAIAVDGRVAELNPAAEELFGKSRARLVGRPAAFPDPPFTNGTGTTLGSALGEVLASGRGLRVPLPLRPPVVAELAPWWTGADVAGALCAFLPAEEHEPPADVAVLAAGLAHEVRNPLAALRGAAELLEGELAAVPVDAGVRGRLDEYLKLVFSEAARVDAIVRRVLDLSKPPTVARAPVRPAELLHELALHARALAAGQGRDVAVEETFDPGLPVVALDRELLRVALANLVRNAIEASPAGTTVRLVAGIDGERRQRGPAGRATRVLRFAVVDEGPGLGGNEARLFTPFFTTKQSGTGLGLLLARRAVEAHGGRLMLATRPAGAAARGGPGTEAAILLPMESTDG